MPPPVVKLAEPNAGLYLHICTTRKQKLTMCLIQEREQNACGSERSFYYLTDREHLLKKINPTKRSSL